MIVMALRLRPIELLREGPSTASRLARERGWNLHLTPEEANEFSRRVTRLVREASRAHAERPPEARRVLVTYRALPWAE
jgi:hypothetical protein